jgi:hypothetical protein
MKLPPPRIPPIKTDWDDVFMKQLMPTSPDHSVPEEVRVPEERAPAETERVVTNVVPKGIAATQSQTAKKKRKRAPRKKIIPEEKVYVEPTELDILGGRGGRSNHHPGNKRYRTEIENLKEWYSKIEDKDEKTDLSQCLVDFCHSYGARFLERDDKGWYIAENIVARRKASQALREDSDPQKRKEKRDRFLAKRSKEQGDARKLKQAKT